MQDSQVCKSCRSRQELSHEYLLFARKNRLRYSRERASQSLEVVSSKNTHSPPSSDRGVAVPEASENSPSGSAAAGGAVVAVLDEAGSRTTAFEFRGLVALYEN